MKIHLILTEDWLEMRQAIVDAQNYMGIFGVSYSSERRDLDLSSEVLYESKISNSGEKKVLTKSLSTMFIYGLHAGKHDKYDCFGILCDRDKSIEQTGLYGQQSSMVNNQQVIEVYASKGNRKQYGLAYSAYTLIHETMHALADFHDVPDTLHADLGRKLTLDQYREILLDRILKKDNEWGLLPLVASKARELIVRASKLNLNIRITEGYRSPERQTQLYAQKPKVTNAKAWESIHQYRCAFDVVFTKEGYDAPPTHWKTLGIIGNELGLDWGGDWSSFVDRPHFEMVFSYELRDFKARTVDWSRYYEEVRKQPRFARDLMIGSAGEDVRMLQKFLNSKGFPVAKSGVGSPGRESNYFGELTLVALARYQKARGLKPDGIFGNITRGKVNSEA